jgi:hypothetical protein
MHRGRAHDRCADAHAGRHWRSTALAFEHATIEGKNFDGMPGMVLYIPPNVVHSVRATPQADGLFFTAKDASHGLQGIKA